MSRDSLFDPAAHQKAADQEGEGRAQGTADGDGNRRRHDAINQAGAEGDEGTRYQEQTGGDVNGGNEYQAPGAVACRPIAEPDDPGAGR